MPLRMRLIALIGSGAAGQSGGGSVLVGWHAASSVRTELRAALDVGTKTMRNGIDELARADDRADELRHLVATFNGNRHVRATLLDARISRSPNPRCSCRASRCPAGSVA